MGKIDGSKEINLIICGIRDLKNKSRINWFNHKKLYQHQHIKQNYLRNVFSFHQIFEIFSHKKKHIFLVENEIKDKLNLLSSYFRWFVIVEEFLCFYGGGKFRVKFSLNFSKRCFIIDFSSSSRTSQTEKNLSSRLNSKQKIHFKDTCGKICFNTLKVEKFFL
jgi:hypothetical protein